MKSEKSIIVEEQKLIAESLASAEESLKVFKELSYNNLITELSPLDRARYDLAILYSLNSMYWMYLRSLGTDTKSHGIMEEMNRIKKMTERIKDMTEKTKKRNLVIDAQAAHRMVKHGLWQPTSKKAKLQATEEEENWDDEIANDTNTEESNTPVPEST